MESPDNKGLPRPAAVGGIAFVILFAVALSLDHLPRGDASLTAVASFYATRSHRLETLAGGYALVFAAIVFLWFLAGMRDLWRAAGVSEVVSGAAYGSGVMFAGLLTAGAACFAAPAAFASFGSEKLVSLDAIRVIPDLRHPLVLVCGMLCAAAFTFSTSIVAIKTSPTGRPLAWFGVAVAVFMLLGGFFFPLAVFLLWVVVTSIRLSRPRRAGSLRTGQREGGASSSPISSTRRRGCHRPPEWNWS